MKKIFLLIAACFSLTAPLAAHPCQGAYVTGFGGANFKQDQKISGDTKLDWETGYALSGSVGYKWEPFRVELEGAYRRNTAKHLGKHYGQGVTSALVNGIYDLDFLQLPSGITPYVGVGIGTALHNGNGKGKDLRFAWQGIAGVALPVSDRVDLITEYRYFNAGFKQDHNHTVGAGLRFWF